MTRGNSDINIETPDKRFLVFQFDTYDPNGGMCDMIESFGKLSEVINYVRKAHADTFQVYDRLKGISVDLDNYDFEMEAIRIPENDNDVNEYDILHSLYKAVGSYLIDYFINHGNI